MVEAIYLCPAGPADACSWEGSAEDIRHHFHNKHRDLVLTTNNFTVNVSRSTVQNRLLCAKSDVYLVQTKVAVPEAKLTLKVRYLGSAEQAAAFAYTVSIRAGNYAFKWLPEEQCQVIYTKDGGVEVDLQMVRLTCGNAKLEYVVCVLDVHQKVVVVEEKTFTLTPVRRRKRELTRGGSLERTFTRNARNRNSFLQNFFYEDTAGDTNSVYSLYLEETIFDGHHPELACATCRSEMCPPIYVCMNGHSVCGACKHYPCRNCHQPVLDIRNSDLEEISLRRQHSCKYAVHGCGERGNCTEIRNHEVNCRFCVYKCCLCPQEGKFAEMKSHFKLLHSSVKVYETLRCKFPKSASFAVIAREHGVFYCGSGAVGGGVVEWTVTFCGPQERWFSCVLRIKGKKEEVVYSFRRNGNVYSLSLAQADLKAAGVKDKYAVLEISQ